jgi:hypothetical protein
MMGRALNGWIFAFLLAFFFNPSYSAGAVESNSSLTGKPTINFSLPSAQDKLVTYSQEYYGRYNVIITFFPAAFTPT